MRYLTSRQEHQTLRQGDPDLSQAIETAIDQGKPAPTFQPSRVPLPSLSGSERAGRYRSRPRHAPSSDEVLQHYLKRVDPEVAESFTSAQRDAIKVMLGTREVARHFVEVRRSVPFGRKRFYTVLLIGREQRSLRRLRREGEISRAFSLAVYAGLAALLLAPAAGIALAFSL